MPQDREDHSRSGRNLARVWHPFQRFFQTESAGGVLLIIAAVIALLWANIYPDSYTSLWELEWSVGRPGLALNLSLREWINDGLMALFFFLVGLEIRREVLIGELASLRRAALPLAAAIGGMVFPALIYTIFNVGTPGARGWGIPMATDIAFALGVLALLGDRVPSSLRIFLAALAIADDLGAVGVIAFFYTESLSLGALAIGLGIFAGLLILSSTGLRSLPPYITLGVALWLAFLLSGVHATVAGVLLALAIPARTEIDTEALAAEVQEGLDELATTDGRREALRELSTELSAVLAQIQPPVQRLEEALEGIVTLFVLPLFALANAGVVLAGGLGAPYTWRVFLGIVLGLLVGKPLGIMIASWIALKGGADSPTGTRVIHLFGASLLAGIGFTMSIFIANLAFGSPALLPAAKIGIVIASPLAGLAGFLVLRFVEAPR